MGTVNPSSVQKVDLQTGRVLKTIPIGGGVPWWIALTPDGKTAYVTNSGWPNPKAPNDIVPIDIATDTAGPPIKVGVGPISIAITPDGSTAYVANMGTILYKRGRYLVTDDFTVTPVNLHSNTPGPPICVGPGPGAIAASLDGRTMYVALAGTPEEPSYDVVPIDVKTNTVGKPMKVGVAPMAIQITPDGKTAYVGNSGWPQLKKDLGDTVSPIDIATGKVGPPIKVGRGPISMAMSPDGKTLYVVNNNYGLGSTFTVSPIDTRTNTPGKLIHVEKGTYSMAVSPDGQTAYTLNLGAQHSLGKTITPIDLRTGRVAPDIIVGNQPTVMVFLPAS